MLLVAVMSGVVGFGMVYQGIAGGGASALIIGVPLLFGGLWWSGRELAKSNLAAKRRRMLNASHRSK